MRSIRIALTAFREEYMRGDWLDTDDNWSDPDARRLRYAILWANYDNTAYRNSVHNWANLYKGSYGMYAYTRRLLGVPYRLGEFWKAHTWAGRLDVEGDEAGNAGALPIDTANDDLRAPIAQIWQWSNWHVKMTLVPLWGSVMGDAFIRVRDDTRREKVYLEAVHPGTVYDLEKDPFGNIKAYTIIEERPDPENESLDVEYRETATRENGRVVFRTFRDGSPYDWREYEDGETAVGAEWSVEYDFIPMVHVMHTDIGLGWGAGEVGQALVKIREIDDGLSMRSDQLRKTVNVKWLFAGMRRPSDGTLSFNRSADTDEKPEIGREEEHALYAPDPSARAQALVANLDIQGGVAHTKQLLDMLEDDYPELKYERLRRGGVLSGEALRIARQPTVTKVQQIRPQYDGALVRAQQMAVAIGGLRGYFSGFGLESYNQGNLNHTIDERDVFKPDEAERYEKEMLFWQAAEQAGKAGVDLDVYLELMGWPQEKIERVLESDGYRAKQAQREMGRLALSNLQESERE